MMLLKATGYIAPSFWAKYAVLKSKVIPSLENKGKFDSIIQSTIDSN